MGLLALNATSPINHDVPSFRLNEYYNRISCLHLTSMLNQYYVRAENPRWQARAADVVTHVKVSSQGNSKEALYRVLQRLGNEAFEA